MPDLAKHDPREATRAERGATKSARPSANSIKQALGRRGKSPTVRLQLTLKVEFAERLETLRQEMKAESYAEVLRTSLRLLERFLAAEKNGSRVFVKDPDGTTWGVDVKRGVV